VSANAGSDTLMMPMQGGTATCMSNPGRSSCEQSFRRHLPAYPSGARSLVTCGKQYKHETHRKKQWSKQNCNEKSRKQCGRISVRRGGIRGDELKSSEQVKHQQATRAPKNGSMHAKRRVCEILGTDTQAQHRLARSRNTNQENVCGSHNRQVHQLANEVGQRTTLDECLFHFVTKRVHMLRASNAVQTKDPTAHQTTVGSTLRDCKCSRRCWKRPHYQRKGSKPRKGNIVRVRIRNGDT
jgi:hypothetical protein